MRETVRRLLDDHAKRRSQREYDDSVDHWLRELAGLEIRIGFLTGRGVVSTAAPIDLWKDETCIGAWGATLVSARSTRVTNYAGVSYRTSQRTSVRAGQARSVSTPDELRPIDQGTFVVTDHRFVFVGGTQNVTWDFRKLVAVNEGRDLFVFHVSNRQRAQGIVYRGTADNTLREAIEAGRARADGSAPDIAADLAARYLELTRRPPNASPGVTTDPRVQKITEFGERLSAPHEVAATEPRSRIRLGLANTRPEIVAEGFTLESVIVPVVVESESPNPDWEALDATAAAATEKSATLTGEPFVVLSGSRDWLANQIDLAGTHLVICASADDLGALGIEPTDVDEDRPPALGYADRTFDEVLEIFRSKQHNVTVRLRAQHEPIDPRALAMASVSARVNEAVDATRNTFAVVEASADDDLGNIWAQLHGFDCVAFVAPTDQLERAGIPVVDSIDTGTAEPETLPQLAEAPSLTIAGREVPGPQRVVIDYLSEHGGTVADCDFVAGTFEAITPELVRATRRMSSRISKTQEQWFIERGTTANWESVPPDAQLRDADPTVADGLYDAAAALYAHFRDGSPKGIGIAKTSKCLYLMRPGLFPILDSRLRALYDVLAREAATSLSEAREQLRGAKWSYWEAIRRDLLANADALGTLRNSLLASDWDFARQAGERFTDIRLLDICSWLPGEEPATDDD